MKEVLLDSLIDTLKLLPYLLITFLVLEFIEHKLSHKNQKILSKNKKCIIFYYFNYLIYTFFLFFLLFFYLFLYHVIYI